MTTPNYEPTIWRLLNTGRSDGPTNMAIDEAISESVAAGESQPALRFYGWQPACLSLGLAQEWDVADWQSCTQQGWGIIRRPTGGRAILHIDELTYTVAAPDHEPRVQGGVIESYQRLSEALAAGLRLLGLDPARARPYYQDKGEAGPACFDGPSHYEITIGQRKLIGSAQMRKKGVVLQHGSLPLHGDITRIAKALAVDVPGQRMAIAARLQYRATTLADCLGRSLEFEQVAEALRQGFSQALNLTFVAGELTPKEEARTLELRHNKYAAESWTKRI